MGTPAREPKTVRFKCRVFELALLLFAMSSPASSPTPTSANDASDGGTVGSAQGASQAQQGNPFRTPPTKPRADRPPPVERRPRGFRERRGGRRLYRVL